MPPTGKLPSSDIQLVLDWIKNVRPIINRQISYMKTCIIKHRYIQAVLIPLCLFAVIGFWLRAGFNSDCTRSKRTTRSPGKKACKKYI
jgi:hypothetical protein